MALLLRRVRNHLIPIHQLPNELLLRIFDFTINPNSNRCTEDVVGLSQVCSRWYSIATDYSPLWTNVRIYDGPPSICSLGLQRSKAAPLTVNVDLTHNYFGGSVLANMRLLSSHFGAMRSLAILIRPHLDHLLEANFFLPAPLLENLEICAQEPREGSEDEEDESFEETVIHLPEDLFSANMPSLKRVKLINVDDTAFYMFINLTSLEIHTTTDLELDSSEFLDLLRRNPLLESLEVDGYHPDPDWNNTQPAIIMPFLSKLHLARTASRQILSHLATSVLTDFQLDHLKFSAYEPPTMLYYALPDDTTQFNITRHLTDLSVELSGSVSYAIQGHGCDGVGNFSIYDCEHLSECLDYLSRCSFPALVTLSVTSSQDPFVPASSQRLLANSPSLKTLQTTDSIACESLLRALAEDKFLCPQLENLMMFMNHISSHQRIFPLIKSILTSRTTMGRVIRVALASPMAAREDIAPAWSAFYKEYNSVDRSEAGPGVQL